MKRLALALVSFLAPFVPKQARERWVEEWCAEIDHAARALGGRRFGSLRLLRMALGAIPDMIAVRRARRLSRVPSTPRGHVIRGLGQDFRYSLRALAASPAFSAAVIGSLTLGIAVNAAAFAMINALFFTTPPGVADPDRLVKIELCRVARDGDCLWQASSFDDYAVLRTAIPSLPAVAARVQVLAAARIRGEALIVRAAVVSSNYFEVLGARLVLGSGFPAGELASEQNVAVISHALWQRQFHGDPAVLGEFIDVGTTAVRIVGIAPKEFLVAAGAPGNAGREIWLPIAVADAVLGRAQSGPRSLDGREATHYIEYVGRLGPGASLEQARAEGEVLGRRLTAGKSDARGDAALRISRFAMRETSDAVAALGAIMPLPLLVLAIACLNATSLLLARATYRMRDTRVRLALGATGWRIVRHVLAESLLLAAAAAAVSIPLTLWAIRLAQPYVPMAVQLDWQVLGFTLLVGLASAVLFGVLPAVRIAAQRSDGWLSSSRVGEGGAATTRLRKALVIAQVSASLALLATGGQSMTAVSSLMSNTGAHDPERLLLVSFDLDKLKMSAAAGQQFYAQLLDRTAHMPQVEAAGLARANAMWTFGRGRAGAVVTVWLPEDAPKSGRSYSGGYAGGDLFEAVGLKMVQGRGFAPDDARARPQVAVVNRPLADSLFGGAAIGRTVRVAPRRYEESVEVRIVGVIEPTIERSYSPKPVPAIYLPVPLQYDPALTLYVRSRTSVETFMAELRQAVAAVDPRVPFIDVGTLQQRTEHRNQEEHLLAAGATILGGIALFLAAAGLYGLFSFIVSLRQREIGVRMALGAEPASIRQLVLRQAMRLALSGGVVGGILAIVAGAIVNANIHGTPSIDVIAFLASVAILTASMLVAGFIPASRAARVDPMVVLRQEM